MKCFDSQSIQKLFLSWGDAFIGSARNYRYTFATFFNVIPLKKTGAEVIDLVKEMGKWNPIFCIPVGDDPDIVRNSKVLPNYHVYCIWQNVNFECIKIW